MLAIMLGQRVIFVGSSSEALSKAKHICKVLTTKDVVGRLWTDVFEPGYLTFEALEQMLHQCCAAVFIASADDELTIRGVKVKSPRANILLEFGLVAGRLGRHSVAICQYDSARLPSDLAGLTMIPMDPPEGHHEGSHFREEAEKRLRVWSSRLLATADGIPRTATVHGYTGRWDFEICLQQWRDVKVSNPSYAQVKGYLDLFLTSTGQAGRGLAHGHLTFNLPKGGADSKPFQGEYRTAHDVMEAVCGTDGSLELTTEAFALQRTRVEGIPPVELAGIDLLPEPWSARWKLAPTADARTLKGTIESGGNIRTHGTVIAVKHPESAD